MNKAVSSTRPDGFIFLSRRRYKKKMNFNFLKGVYYFMNALKNIAKKYSETSLILRIAIGIVVGAILAAAIPQASFIGIFGDLFVGALKAIAPVLVAVLVMSSLCQGSSKLDRRFGLVIFLYMLTTFLAAFIAVLFSFAFPQTLDLAVESAEQAAPGGLGEVLYNLLMNIIVNPLQCQLHGHPLLVRGPGHGAQGFRL